MKRVYLIFSISLLFILACTATVKNQPGENSNVPQETPPEMIHSPKINYPEQARINGYQADVWVKSSHDSTGAITDVEILKVDGQAGIGFEEEALRVARNTKWKPATKNGVPEGSMVTYKIIFRLKL